MPSTPTTGEPDFFEWRLEDALQKREREGLLRALKLSSGGVDFTSNDYLGMRNDRRARGSLEKLIQSNAPLATGSGGSRLLGGNPPLAEEAEKLIADFFGAESALIFSSGYAANTGLVSALAGRSDTVIADELVHASIHDGIRLSGAKRIRFAHNNTSDLQKKLEASEGPAFVIVESVYSMDGDLAALDEISRICKQFGAALIVDEAHSIGIFAEGGKGLCLPEHKAFARIVTFGKAAGAHGAAVLGSSSLKEYLVNFARSFIYSTAPAPHFYLTILNALEWLPRFDPERRQLFALIAQFKNLFGHASPSPIQSLLAPGNEQVRSLAAFLQQKGFDVRPVLSPTVPAGTERIRICLHAYNNAQQLVALHEGFEAWKNR